MASTMRQYGAPILLGSAAGAAMGFATFKFFEWQIDKQLRTGGAAMITEGEKELRREALRLIDEEVPPRVRSAVDDKLREFGLTPSSGRQIAQVLDAADRIGLLGLQGTTLPTLGQLDEKTNTWMMVGAGTVLLGAIGVMVAAGLSDPPKRSRR